MADKNTELYSEWTNLLVNEKLRKQALGRDAVTVYSSNLKQIIWTNTSGACLFGGGSIGQFMTMRPDPGHPFLGQLASIARQLGKEPIHRALRIVNKTRSRFLQCEIDQIDLDHAGLKKDYKKAIIVTCKNPAMEELAETEFLRVVFDSLAESGAIVAICDEFGNMFFATDQFVEAGVQSEAIGKAYAEAENKIAVSIKTGNASDKNTSVFLYLLADAPRILLVVVDGGCQKQGQDDITSKQAGSEEGDKLPAGETPHSGRFFGESCYRYRVQDESSVNREKEKNPSQGNNVSLNQYEDTPQYKEALTFLTDKSNNVRLAGCNRGEASLQNDSNRKNIINPEKKSGGCGVTENFVFNPERESVRFTWTTSVEQIFTSLSPELACAIGPNAADIVGKKWSDVSMAFGFDRNEEIDSLLKGKGAWSGKSILWPVQETNFRVPVDLAALPSFSSGKCFEGFIGFGVVRISEFIEDDDEYGLVLANRWQIRDETSSSVQSVKRCETSPVRIRSDRQKNKELSKEEEEMFLEVGRKLRDSSESMFSSQECHDNEKKVSATSPEADSRQTNTENFTVGTASEASVDTSLLEELPVPTLVCRGNDILFTNREFLTLTGHADLTALRKTGGFDQLFSENSEDIRDKSEVVLNGKDGKKIKVRVFVHNVPWDAKRALLLSFRQPEQKNFLKNKKGAPEAVWASELQNILDTATDGIIILNRDGMIQSVNRPAEVLFGRSNEAVSKKPVYGLFSDESHKNINQALLSDPENPGTGQALNNGYDIIGIGAKGNLIPLYVTIGRIGASDQYCMILRDMTPWRKTREELVEAKKQAEDASDHKTSFLARVSHEIRTPLNAIIGFSDVMIKERFGPVDNNRYREYLRDINRSGVHVLDLINDLLDISKIEAGKMEMSFEAVNLNRIVGETVALLQPQANESRVIIRTSLSRAVPEVVADVRSIRQIVLNLVSNGIKFTGTNGQVIVSTVHEESGGVALRVRDTGRGMSNEEVGVALKPFGQVAAVSEINRQGTGLGLPLTKALVKANKARFDIESKQGEGTIVHIQFPSRRVLAN